MSRMTRSHPHAATVSGLPGALVPAARRIATLGAGDALVFERLSHYETRNDGMTPAVVLVVRSGAPSNRSTGRPADATPPPVQLVPPAPGPTAAMLAGWPPRPLSRRPCGRSDRAHLAGTWRRAGTPPGRARRVRGRGVGEPRTDGGGRQGLGPASTRRRDARGDSTRVETGAGLAFDAGTTVAFAPAGNAPLVVLVISIGPPVGVSASVS